MSHHFISSIVTILHVLITIHGVHEIRIGLVNILIIEGSWFGWDNFPCLWCGGVWAAIGVRSPPFLGLGGCRQHERRPHEVRVLRGVVVRTLLRWQSTVISCSIRWPLRGWSIVVQPPRLGRSVGVQWLMVTCTVSIQTYKITTALVVTTFCELFFWSFQLRYSVSYCIQNVWVKLLYIQYVLKWMQTLDPRENYFWFQYRPIRSSGGSRAGFSGVANPTTSLVSMSSPPRKIFQN